MKKEMSTSKLLVLCVLFLGVVTPLGWVAIRTNSSMVAISCLLVISILILVCFHPKKG